MNSEQDLKPRVVVIVGPTAVGKSDLAVTLAERFGGEVVNADSMQVYRGMDIGTAKPSLKMRQRVPHHLIDVVDPDCNFTASDFRREAERAIADIHSRGKRIFLVGGTGLYIRILLKGLVDAPGGDPALRDELKAFAEREGNDALLRELAAVDPETAGAVHPNNRVRIIRALEVYRMTGRPLSSFRAEHGFATDYYRSLKIGLSAGREELYRRIDARVDRMLEEGLVDEVRGLLAAGCGPDLKPMRSLGYKEICAHLSGKYPLDEAVRLIKRDTRRYAKRQMTWFNADAEINWFEYSANFATICKHVIEFFD